MASITIDRDECISCGACWSTCPEIYEESDDGLTQIVSEYQVDGDQAEGEVPEDLEDCAVDGADSCPVEIIHVS